MSILSNFEDKISGAIEGMFSGLFKSPVQPAELARASAKEMDRSRKVGVGKIYVANVYNVLLSPADEATLGTFVNTLATELEEYLLGYSRERGYRLSSKPSVHFHVDEALRLGKFEVIGELVSDTVREPDLDLAPAPARVISPPPGVASAPADAYAPARVVSSDSSPYLELEGGRRFNLDDKAVYSIGRLSSNDIALQDSSVSRNHATLVREGSTWTIRDNDSANGTMVNGQSVEQARLRDNDAIALGTSRMLYKQNVGEARREYQPEPPRSQTQVVSERSHFKKDDLR